MSEKELNAYRLTSMEEPSDEMLAVIMKEAAAEAAAATKKALADYFAEISAMMPNRRHSAPMVTSIGRNISFTAFQ